MQNQGWRVAIKSQHDVLRARQHAREIAAKMGFEGGELTLIAAATSEIARNIADFAEQGEITFDPVQQGGKQGLVITARDRGPGIPDVARAMQYGYSSGKGLGVGLPGAKWLMDEFEISSKPGKGTTVTMKKWLGSAGRPRTHES